MDLKRGQRKLELPERQAKTDAKKIFKLLCEINQGKVKIPDRKILHRHGIQYSTVAPKELDDRMYPSELAHSLVREAEGTLLIRVTIKTILIVEDAKSGKPLKKELVKSIDNISPESTLILRLRKTIFGKLIKKAPAPDFVLEIEEDDLNHIYRVSLTSMKALRTLRKYSPSSKRSSSAPHRPARG